MGVVLLQNKYPIAYFSEALKVKALIMSTYEKELFAFVATVQKWRPYLLRMFFTTKIDH